VERLFARYLSQQDLLVKLLQQGVVPLFDFEQRFRLQREIRLAQRGESHPAAVPVIEQRVVEVE
jgi:hypothetical protein